MQVWNWFNCSSENFNFVSEEALSQQQQWSKDWERRDFPCSQLDYYRIHLVSLILVLSFFSQNLEGIHCNLPLCKSNSSEPEQWANHKDVKSSLKASIQPGGRESVPGQELSPVAGDVGSLLHARVTKGFTISTQISQLLQFGQRVGHRVWFSTLLHYISLEIWVVKYINSIFNTCWILSLFSCPQQLNRTPCPLVGPLVRHH